MYKILSKCQRKELLRELRKEGSRKYAERIKVILLSDQGKTNQSIADYLFLDEGTVRNWKKRYLAGGLKDLLNDNYLAKSCLLSPRQLNQLEKHLEENIYQRTADIVKHIKDTYKVGYKANSVRRILRILGFSYKKAKKSPSKADKDKQESFVRSYKGLKRHGDVFFMDSTHPRLCPVAGYGWIKKGVDKFIPTNAGRVRLNITGAVNIETMDIITRQTSTVDEDAICLILKAIHAKKNGNTKQYVVLDNAPYNKSKKVRALAKELEIRLKYIPPYSPNLNLIERLWRFFREKVLSMKHYETLDIFSKTCSNFFRGIRKYKEELKSLMTDNFQILGT